MAVMARSREIAAPMTQRRKNIRRHLLIYAALLPFVIIAVFPIYWMAITAFKQDPDLYRMENIPFFFNMKPTLRNFDILFHQTNYGAWLWNTFMMVGELLADSRRAGLEDALTKRCQEFTGGRVSVVRWFQFHLRCR